MAATNVNHLARIRDLCLRAVEDRQRIVDMEAELLPKGGTSRLDGYKADLELIAAQEELEKAEAELEKETAVCPHCGKLLKESK